MPESHDVPILEVERPQNKRTRAVLVDGRMEIRWGRDVRSEADRNRFRAKVHAWLQKKTRAPGFDIEKTKVQPKPRSMTVGDQFRVYMDERAELSLETLERIRKDLDILSRKFSTPYGRINESRARSYRGLSHNKNNISLRLYDLQTLEPLPYHRVLRTAIHELAHNHKQAKAHGKRWKAMETKMVEFAVKEGLLREEDSRGPAGVGESVDARLGELTHEQSELFRQEIDRLLRYGPKPNLTVDGIIVSKGRELLLIKRKNPPFQGLFALPGGFVDHNESVEEAVVREVKEETDLDCEIHRLVGVYSKPGRDPRGHVVSVVFSMRILSGTATSGDDAAAVKWFPLDGFLPELAFDHNEIIEDFKRTRD